MLFSRDFPGLVIKIALTGVEIDQTSGVVRAAAGENWHCLGLELYRRKPVWARKSGADTGSVGAALSNIGAYGIELASLIKHVEGLDTRTGEVYSGCWAVADYRDSIFKKRRCSPCISEVVLQLHQDWIPELSYLSRDRIYETSIETPEQLFSLVCRVRRRKLPDPKLVGT